jgi:hypothetical protein
MSDSLPRKSDSWCTIGGHKIENKLYVIDQRHEDLAHTKRDTIRIPIEGY